jgi:hypothetical protein
MHRDGSASLSAVRGIHYDQAPTDRDRDLPTARSPSGNPKSYSRQLQKGQLLPVRQSARSGGRLAMWSCATTLLWPRLQWFHLV